jgi:hypothetical protein
LIAEFINKQASDFAALSVTLNDDIDKLDKANQQTIKKMQVSLDEIMGQRLQKVTDDV